MSEKLILTQEYFIARGGERECYEHPLDSTKVIKILYKKNGVYAYDGNRNNLEYRYYKFLEKSQISFSHIINCYEFVETNLGKGLIFDKVCDYNGNISIAFSKLIRKNKFSDDFELFLIEELKEYVFKNNILFIDNGLHNILCCEYEKDKYKLIIIDGLGAKREGFKFWLYLNSKIYTKYKVKTQWNKFIKKYEFFKKNVVK
jgi:hypothetical protein